MPTTAPVSDARERPAPVRPRAERAAPPSRVQGPAAGAMLRSGDPRALRTAHPDALRSLQRSVGNAGLAAALAQPGRTDGRARDPRRVLARAHLPTTAAFRTDLGRHDKDETIERIIALLETWNRLETEKDRAATRAPATGHKRYRSEQNDFDRAATAKLIQFETDRWIDGNPEHLATTAGGAIIRLRDKARRRDVRLTTVAPKRFPSTAGDQAADRLKEHVARKSAQVTAKDMHSAFERLGAVIEGAVPALGSKAEVEGELEFAVDPSMIGFVGLRIKLEADRPETTRLKTRAELTFTAGAKIPNLGRARFDMGGYVEVQGRSGAEAARLISYAIYRTARRHREVPRWLVNKMWGGDWESNPGYAKAERWAGAVESSVLKGNADGYAESGLMVGGMAEVGLQAGDVAAKAKGSVQAGVGERWDEAAITGIQTAKGWTASTIDDIVVLVGGDATLQAKTLHTKLVSLGHAEVSEDRCNEVLKRTRTLDPAGPHYGADLAAVVRRASPGYRPGLGEASREEATFGRQKGRGERTFWVKGQAEADISIAKVAMKYERLWQTRGRDALRATHLREHKFEARFGVGIPLAKTLGADLLGVLVMGKLISAVIAFDRTAADSEALDKQEKKSRTAGAAARGSADFASIITQLAHVPAKDFTWAGEATSAIAPGVFGSVNLFVVIDYKRKAPDAKGIEPWELNLQVAEERTFKFEADLAAVAGRFAAKTQERMFRAQLRHDKTWQYDVAGDVSGGDARTPKQKPAVATGTG